MQHFIKNLIAAAILFLSLITSLAFGYAITSNDEKVNKPTVKTIVKLDSEKQTMFRLSDTFKLMIPKVND